VRLLPWNLNGRRDVEAQLLAIASRAADLLALQEVTPRSIGLLRAALPRCGLPHFIDSFATAARWAAVGPRRYGVIIASRFPLSHVTSSRAVPWPERLRRNVVRAVFATTAIIIATSVTVGAQQQAPSPRAWPCGGRLDPSYFRVAEGSGGQLLLLAPDEIADSTPVLLAITSHPQTIFRLAGSITPGLNDFQIPIDSSVESVVFSVSVQCLEAAYV
jgi:hypothetical protein